MTTATRIEPVDVWLRHSSAKSWNSDWLVNDIQQSINNVVNMGDEDE